MTKQQIARKFSETNYASRNQRACDSRHFRGGIPVFTKKWFEMMTDNTRKESAINKERHKHVLDIIKVKKQAERK